MIKAVLNTAYDFGEQSTHIIGVTDRGLDTQHLQKAASNRESVFKGVDIKPEKGKAIVHVVAMGAAPHYPCNKNGDLFYDTARTIETPEGGDIKLKKGLDESHITFETDAKVYKEHFNTKDDKVYGDVLKSKYNKDLKRVELLLSIPVDEWQEELGGIEKGNSFGVSMSARMAFDTCNVCGKNSKTQSDYCFVPDTLISMRDGHPKEIQDVKVGDVVMSAAGVPTTVIKTFKREVSEEIVNINHSLNGFKLRCTKNHPILSTSREDNLCFYSHSPTGKCFEGNRERCGECRKTVSTRDFTPAGELRVQDVIFSPGLAYTEGGSDSFDTEDAWVFGLFVAEGCYSKVGGVRKSLDFSLHEDETDFVKRLDAYFRARFPKRNGVKVYTRKGSKGVSARFYSPEACELFHENIEEYAKNKYLKNYEILSTSALAESFLAGVWDGDGYWGEKGDRLNSASINLVFQMSHILTTLGYSAYTGTASIPGGPTNRSKLCTQYYVNTKLSSAEQLMRRAVIRGMNKGFITKIGVEDYIGSVYNFETEDGTYVAGGLAVHNCDHLKNDLGQLSEDGHQVAAINDSVTFFDISGVKNPADRIAFGLLKAASAKIIGGAELAERLNIPTPELPERYKFAATLKKLAVLEKTFDGQADDILAVDPNCAAAETPDLPETTLNKIATCGLSSAEALGALADVKVTLSLHDFMRIVMGSKFDSVKASVPEAEKRLPGVFSRMCVNPLIPDGAVELPSTPFPFSLGPMLKDIIGSNGFGAGPKRQRVTVTVIKGNSPFKIKSSSVTASDGLSETMAHLYGQYKVALCHKFSDDKDLTFTSALSHYITS